MKLSRGIIISKTLFKANIIFGTPSGNEVTKVWTFSLWNGIKNWEAFITERLKKGWKKLTRSSLHASRMFVEW